MVPTPGVPVTCRLVEKNTAGIQLVELRPSTREETPIAVEYIRRLRPMRETTAGVATISASGTSVTGQSGSRFTEAVTGFYFRVDAFGQGADSEWYRVRAVTHDSALTLGIAFGLSGATSAAYTLCSAPEIPEKVQPAILYAAVAEVLQDQNDPLYAMAESRLGAIISDARNDYATRVYAQEVETVAEEWQYRR